MSPPEAPANGQKDRDAAANPAVLVCPETLRLRPDFLRAAQAGRHGTAGFLLQARRRDESEDAAPQAVRVGFTASKKIGNAVLRNRAKRRLRALARAVLPGAGLPGWDYVLVARPEATVSRDFAAMQADLARALASLHAKTAAPGAAP